MDVVKENSKRNGFAKAWERCRSLKHYFSTGSKRKGEEVNNDGRRRNRQVAPEGCFSVYVGPEKQRFVVKAKFANHPLFKMLLEDAELEYGYNSQGPLLLPCEVELFYRVLAEMDNDDNCSEEIGTAPIWSPLSVLCSPRRPNICGTNKGYGAYRPLTPPRMFKLNQ